MTDATGSGPTFIFVLGCQRSGTTLVGQILGAHSAAVLIDEHDGVHEWADAALSGKTATQLQRYLRRSYRLARRNYRFPGERISVLGRPRKHIRYVVVKAPNLTFDHEALARVFPTGRIVFLTRDIRAIVASTLKLGRPIVENQTARIVRALHLRRDFPQQIDQLVSEATPWHTRSAIVGWIKMYCVEYFRAAGFDCIQVSFEELVRAPEESCRALLEALGMPFDRSCLEHHRILRGTGPGGTRRDQPIEDGPSNRWRRQLSSGQEQDIWETVGGFCESLGYSR